MEYTDTDYTPDHQAAAEERHDAYEAEANKTLIDDADKERADKDESMWEAMVSGIAKDEAR